MTSLTTYEICKRLCKLPRHLNLHYKTMKEVKDENTTRRNVRGLKRVF